MFAVRCWAARRGAMTAHEEGVAAPIPKTAEAWFEWGLSHYRQRKFSDAIAAFGEAIDLRPHFPAAHVNLGNALKETGRVGDAITAYKQAIAQKSAFVEAWSNLGVALYEQGRLEEAIAAYGSALKIDANRPETISNLGLVLQAQIKFGEATCLFRCAIALRPDEPESYVRLANALRDIGEVEEAGAAYRQALALKPDHYEAIFNLANLSYADGKIEEAIDGYQRALAINPDFVPGYSNLGNTLRVRGRTNEAIVACRRALALKPDFPDAQFNLSLALLSLHHDQEGWHQAALLPKSVHDHASRNRLVAPVSAGELVDKITILKIKSKRITDSMQLRHIRRELELLLGTWEAHGLREDTFYSLSHELEQVNAALWNIEDALRICERERDFGPRFVELARSVYRNNDRRAALKRRINELAGSSIIEEKSYPCY